MSLISIFGPKCSTEVLNASECHYLLSRGDKTCQKIEVIVKPNKKTQELDFLFHGKILQGDGFKKIINKKLSPYRKLLEQGNVFTKVTPSRVESSSTEGIIDCGSTFKEPTIKTNQGYEGTDFMKNVTCDANGTTCSIYGVENIDVPECSFVTRPYKLYSKVEAKRNDGKCFEPDKLYAFRIIFFLSYSETDLELINKVGRFFKQLYRLTFHGDKDNYKVHFFCLPGDVIKCYENLNLESQKKYIEGSRLYLKLSALMEIDSLKQKLDQSPLDPSEKAELKKELTSDLFIFTGQYAAIDIPSLRGSRRPDWKNPRYIMFSPDNKERNLKIKRYHVKIGDTIERAFHKTYIHANKHDEIKVSINFGYPRIMGLRGFWGNLLFTLLVFTFTILSTTFLKDNPHQFAYSFLIAIGLSGGIFVFFTTFLIIWRAARKVQY